MINIIPPVSGDPTWAVWTDAEGSYMDGHCIGVGKTEKEALADALTELGADLAEVRLRYEAEPDL